MHNSLNCWPQNWVHDVTMLQNRTELVWMTHLLSCRVAVIDFSSDISRCRLTSHSKTLSSAVVSSPITSCSTCSTVMCDGICRLRLTTHTHKQHRMGVTNMIIIIKYYFIVRPKVDQRAGQHCLPHIDITKTEKTELKHKN